MNSKLVGPFTAVALMLLLALPGIAAPKPGMAKARVTASAQPSAPAAEPTERHPQIRAALAALGNAKEHLEHAAHDFPGHPVDDHLMKLFASWRFA